MSLKLKPLAIGSLPHKSTDDALEYIFSLFTETPFWPQLANVNKSEDMIMQYTQSISALQYDEKNAKYVFTPMADDFYEKLEEFYIDYETIVSENDFELLEKYAITEPFSSAIKPFLKRIAELKPEYAKGHVTGPFTWGTSLCDEEGRCAFFDATLRDVVTKAVTLKALWQIEQIKKASPETTPIIFLDEPAVCQYGTSAFVTVQRQDITDSLKEITTILKQHGALVGIHCCGKADWEMMIDAGFDILNLDAYLYAQNLSLFPQKVENFLKNGGYIAWGVVPTLDKNALEKIDLEMAINVFDKAVEHLTAKNIDKNLIINQSALTPSCGAGSLSEKLAKKAMELTIELSKELSKKYKEEV